MAVAFPPDSAPAHLHGSCTLQVCAYDADILLTVHGQSVQERTGPGRAIIARLELLTEYDRYRWLNTSFVVGEGEIDEETEEWWIHAFVCVNEVAEHPPGIGQAPPEAFR